MALRNDQRVAPSVVPAGCGSSEKGAFDRPDNRTTCEYTTGVMRENESWISSFVTRQATSSARSLAVGEVEVAALGDLVVDDCREGVGGGFKLLDGF